MKNNVDGLNVDIKQARFTGYFDLSEDDDLLLDSEVVFVVRARPNKIGYSVRANGDVVAMQVLKVIEAAPLYGEARATATVAFSEPPALLPSEVEAAPDEEWEPVRRPPGVMGQHPVEIPTEIDEPVFIPEAPVPGPEVVGVLKRHKKDPQLAKFLSEDYR